MRDVSERLRDIQEAIIRIKTGVVHIFARIFLDFLAIPGYTSSNLRRISQSSIIPFVEEAAYHYELFIPGSRQGKNEKAGMPFISH